MRSHIVKTIVLAALMSALTIVFDRFSISTPLYKFTLHPFPLMLSGIIFGAGVGGLTGLASGLIGQLLSFGITPTTPLWVLSYVIWGTFPRMLLCLFKKIRQAGDEKMSAVLAAVFVTSLVVTSVNAAVIYLDGMIMGYPVEMTVLNICFKCALSLGMAFFYGAGIYFLKQRLFLFERPLLPDRFK